MNNVWWLCPGGKKGWRCCQSSNFLMTFLLLFFREEFTSVERSNGQQSICAAHRPVLLDSTLKAKLQSQMRKWWWMLWWMVGVEPKHLWQPELFLLSWEYMCFDLWLPKSNQVMSGFQLKVCAKFQEIPWMHSWFFIFVSMGWTSKTKNNYSNIWTEL